MPAADDGSDEQRHIRHVVGALRDGAGGRGLQHGRVQGATSTRPAGTHIAHRMPLSTLTTNIEKYNLCLFS